MDDEPNIRWTMAELLKREGYDALTASDFESALSILESNKLDAAIVDIILPRKSGIELLKEMNNREPSMPVIMITGEPNISQIPEIVRAGAFDFISKPVIKDALLKVVSKAVEKKRLVDETRSLQDQVKHHAEQLEVTVARRTRELAEAHKFLNIVLDSSTEYALVAIDRGGRITLFNRGAELIFGHSAEEIKGRRAAELTAEDMVQGQAPFLNFAMSIASEGRHQSEMQLRRSDGSWFTASVAITPICEAEEELMGYLIVAKDLTADRLNEEHLRQMQEQLARNEKIAALGRMAAQVAHEVKNPLAGLRLYTLHLKSKVDGKLADNEMALVDKIIEGINQLSDTAEQVLGFARTITLTRRSVDLNRIIKDSLELLEPQLNENNIKVNLNLAEPSAVAMLDEVSMRSTLINLMLNSIQAMGEGGELIVSTRASEETVRLSIADTGCGMTEDQMKNIFEPFYTTKSQGLGLGMSFASKIIEMHGGEVSVESHVNRGTSISILLPMEGEKANEARC